MSDAEIVVQETLSVHTAPAFCRAVRDAVARRPARVWLNLEPVKACDAVGIAVLFQAVRLVEAQDQAVAILPSAAVFRALLDAGVVEDVPLEPQGARPPASGWSVEVGELAGEGPPLPVARTAALGVRPVAWSELDAFAGWARDPLLDQMVGSHLLYLCRNLGPYHPDFVARVQHDPTSITLFVVPTGVTRPVGFLRLYGIHPIEGFAFLETVIADARAIRAGHGVRASRLVLSWAMDVLGVRRVEAKAFAYNTLSINALRRNGFEQEGVLRETRLYDGQHWDILVFAILEDAMRRERARDALAPMGLWGDVRA
jgi:hypothetical protein